MDKISAAIAMTLGLFVLLVVGAQGGLGVGIPYKPKALEAAADLATSLFVVALFLERALAVINDLLFGKEQQLADAAFFASGSATARKGLAEVSSKKEMTRLAVGFLFGLLVSGAGPRTLEGLLNLSALQISDSHRALFYGVDIVLTAGLLAGGSNGLALIIEILKKRAQSTYWNLMDSLRARPHSARNINRRLVPNLVGRIYTVQPFDFTAEMANGDPLPVVTSDFVFSVKNASTAHITADGIQCGYDAVLQLTRSVNSIELDVTNKAQATVIAWCLNNNVLQPTPSNVLPGGAQTVRFDLENIVRITFDTNGELFLHTIR